jgi:hypothetical protein
MEIINVAKARELYGNIGSNLEDITRAFPLCICRGSCICNATSSTKPELYKLNIEQIRNNYQQNNNYKV